MASRIDQEPDKAGNRAHEMSTGEEWDSETIRFWIDDPLMIEPIIAKGNWFDGVEAWW